jgi:hypothetical protein
MMKKASLAAFVLALGLAALSAAPRAEAGVVVGVGIGLPGVAVVTPPPLWPAPYYYPYWGGPAIAFGYGYYPPYYYPHYGYHRYYGPGGYGWHGGWHGHH